MTHDSLPPPAEGPSQASWKVHLGIFLVSLAVLALEVLQTRLFSLMLWHHVTYFVVTITLLGFAASGTAMAIFPALYRGRAAAKASLYALLFALTTFLSLRLLGALRPQTLGGSWSSVDVAALFFSYFYLVIPFFFAGLSVGVLLKAMTSRAGVLYAANLAGSGVGCFLFVLVITPLGGPAVTLLTAFIAALGALALAAHDGGKGVRRLSLGGTLLFLALTLAAYERPDAVLPVPVARTKLLARELSLGKKIERTLWSPLCRIDVLPVDPEEKRVYQDGDAPTTIWSGKKASAFPYDSYFYSLGYIPLKGTHPDVLVIGPGGGIDVENALHYGARRIYAVEINPVTLKMVRRDYRAFSARGRKHPVYEFPQVRPVASEGRAWVRRSPFRFDLIQMTGTDTYAALASGAYVFSESYLYTEQAFEEYLEHLKKDGIIAVLRFRFEPARESLKLASIAARALEDEGVRDPGKHILVINITIPLGPAQEKLIGIKEMLYAVTLVKRSPWTAAEIALYDRWIRAVDGKGFRARFGFAPAAAGKKARGDKEYLDFFAAAAAGKEADFFARYPYDVTPITDDLPFFFKFHKWSTFLEGKEKVGKLDYEALAGRAPIGLKILLSLLVFVSLAVLVLVILPLFFLPRRGGSPQKGRVFTYFFGIGLGFIFAEVASLQRFVLFLGHPTYSLTVVLFSFLLFMGLGSLVSQGRRIGSTAPLRRALGLVILFLLLHVFLLPRVFQAFLPSPEGVRMLVAVTTIAPLAFFMGFAFPLGLRITGGIGEALVPWAWGVNGAASVIGSVLAVILAMAGGFSLVLGLSTLFYLAALALPPEPAP